MFLAFSETPTGLAQYIFTVTLFQKITWFDNYELYFNYNFKKIILVTFKSGTSRHALSKVIISAVNI